MRFIHEPFLIKKIYIPLNLDSSLMCPRVVVCQSILTATKRKVLFKVIVFIHQQSKKMNPCQSQKLLIN